jgi:hypothetical protein
MLYFMKTIKLFVVIVALIFSTILLTPEIARGQMKVGGVDISKVGVEYVELGGYDHVSVFYAFLDYGQKSGSSAYQIQNDKGEPASFKSSIDALNFVCKNGWELVSSYSTQENRKRGTGTGQDYKETDLGMKHIVHFILRRKS